MCVSEDDNETRDTFGESPRDIRRTGQEEVIAISRNSAVRKFYSSRRWWLALITLLGIFVCIGVAIVTGKAPYEGVLVSLVAIPTSFCVSTTIDRAFENKNNKEK